MKKSRLTAVFAILMALTLCVFVFCACGKISTDDNKKTDDIVVDNTPKYEVTFLGGTDATGTAPTIAKQKEGASVTLPQNTFTKDEYLFDGWTDGNDTYDAGEAYVMPAAAVTFTATWRAAPKYAVRFDANGGNGTSPVLGDTAAGKQITLPQNPYTKAHFHFSGWHDGTNAYNAGATYTMPSATVTFTAVWTANATFTVSFVGGTGATGTAPTVSPKEQGDTFTLPSNTFTNATQSVFEGWNDGTDTYLAGATYTMPAVAVSFTAVWDYSETQYYNMAIEKIEGLIYSSFKKEMSTYSYTSLVKDSLDIQGVNLSNGDVYFNAIIEQNNINVYNVAQFGTAISDATTYKELNENVSGLSGVTFVGTSQTVMDENIQNEFVEYITGTEEYLAYLESQGVSATAPAEVLNCTSFDSVGGGQKGSTVSMIVGGKILNFEIQFISAAYNDQGYLKDIKENGFTNIVHKNNVSFTNLNTLMANQDLGAEM